MGNVHMLSHEQANELIDGADFIWHQRFHLADDVMTPGVNDIEWLMQEAGVPQSLAGAHVLDIGTTNGGAAFIAEARGASRVVAVDIYDSDRFGFRQLGEALSSKAEFVQASVYELPELLNQQFDVVLFLGVLYHLRHPLLAIDSLRRLTRGTVYVETAVSGAVSDPPQALFFRWDELNADGSNWFAPTVSCLGEWVTSCGFDVVQTSSWPIEQPARACLSATPSDGEPEYISISTEVPLRVTPS